MAEKTKNRREDPAFVEFADAFRDRLRQPPGTLTDVANAIGFGLTSVSLWGSPQKTSYSLPDIYEAMVAAKAKGVTPAYLAFGDETQPMDAEEQAALKIIRMMNDSEKATLAGTMKAIIDAKNRTFSELIGETKKVVAEEPAKVSESLSHEKAAQPASPPSAPAPAPPKSVPLPRLTQEEFEALMQYRGELVGKSRRRELPLPRAFVKLAPLLLALDPAQRASGQHNAPAPETAADYESLDAVSVQQDATPRPTDVSKPSDSPPRKHRQDKK